MKQLTVFQKSLTFSWLSILVAIMILLVFSSLNYAIFFNSDTMYLPSIYKDLFVNGNGIAGWQFNPAPNFFPDMLGYFLIQGLCGGNFILASFVYPFLQFFLILLLLYIIMKPHGGTNFVAKFVVGSLCVCLLFLIHIYYNEFQPAFELITNSYHLGAFVNVLLGVILIRNYINKKRKSTLILLLGLITIATISDKLFLVQFVGVASILLGIKYVATQHIFYRNLLIKMVLAAGFGWFLFRLIQIIDYINFSSSTTLYSFNKIGESFKIFLEHNWELLSNSIVGFFMVMIPFFVLLFTLIKSILWARKREFDTSFYQFSILFFFLAFTILAPIINGSYNGYDCLRYTVGFYIVGLFIFPFLVFHNSKIHQATIIIISLSIFTLVLIPKYKDLKKFDDYLNYQNNYSKTLDKLKDNYKLKHGIADYWYAKKNMMFSKNEVRIYSVYKDLQPYTHVTNRSWYKQTAKGEVAVFNFVIIDTDEKLTKVKEIFGEVQVIEKEGVKIAKTPEFIYSNNKTELKILTP